MSFDVLTVTVNPAVDKFVTARGCRTGKDNDVRLLMTTAGGKGINVARVLGRLGVRTLATGIVGGSAGGFIKTALDDERIFHDFFDISAETRTNVTVLDDRAGRVTRLLEAGPHLTGSQQKSFFKKFKKLIRRRRYAVFSGRNANGAPDRFYARLIRLTRTTACKVCLDTSRGALAEGLKARPYLIKPNRREAEVLLKKNLSRPASWKGALERLHSRGARIVIVSLGAEGAIAGNGQEYLHARPARAGRCHAVGAGDALMAGFVFAMIKKKKFAEALRTAVAAGTVHARCRHPRDFSFKKVAACAGRVKLVSL